MLRKFTRGLICALLMIVVSASVFAQADDNSSDADPSSVSEDDSSAMQMVDPYPPDYSTTELCYSEGIGYDETQPGCVRQLAVDITYPTSLVGEHPFIAEAINDMLFDLTQNFLDSMKEEAEYSFAYPYSLDVTYEVYHHQDELLSLVFNIYMYTGGAHGNSFFSTFTWNLADETLLTFDDLFQEEFNQYLVLAPLVESALSIRMSGFIGMEPDMDWIIEGTGENPDNYTSFAVSDDALILFFPPYQVAPYAAGPQKVGITFFDLQSVLAPPLYEP